MPELPEVETVVRTLRPQLCGRTIAGVRLVGKALRRPWDPAWERHLCRRQITELRRRGKWIIIGLSGDATLVVHLGMTGRLYVVPRRAALEPHTHLVFPLVRGEQELRFRDVRRFGSVGVFTQPELMHFLGEQRLGPEPFELSTAQLFKSLQGTSRNLKAVLLDQSVVAGVGNIYADESLFEARLNPRQLGRATSREEACRLRRSIVKVLTRAIEHNGSTIISFYYGDGESGSYQNEFRVYGRKGEPCRRCKTAIQGIRLAGRATCFCPRCQPTCDVRERQAPSG